MLSQDHSNLPASLISPFRSHRVQHNRAGWLSTGESKMSVRKILLIVSSLLLLGSAANASQWFAATTGTPSGNGSQASPWDLQTALNQPTAVQPGDTIWVRGGTYANQFNGNLNGTAANPIIVRNYTGEHVTIDGLENS